MLACDLRPSVGEIKLRRMMRHLVTMMWMCLACAAQAHPHVFVDVALRFETNSQGQVEAVEVTWTYDALFSLLVLSDRELDQDADLVLTAAEQEVLLGFDLEDWPKGFDGALFMRTPNQNLTLGTPEAVSVGLKDGRIVTTHRRTVPSVNAKDLVAAPYDPFYYAALTLVSATGLPKACRAEINRADKAEADAQVADLGNTNTELFFEEARVGIYYADRVRVTCSGS